MFLTFILILLRLIHIIAAVVWVGLGLTMFAFINPAVSGEAGFRFLKRLYTHTRVGVVFPAVALLTTVCGVLLYLTGSMSHFTTTGNIVLGIGALAGLGAFGHGGMALGPRTGKLAMQLNTALPDGGTIDATQLSALGADLAGYQRQARVSVALSVVALLGMGLARYL